MSLPSKKSPNLLIFNPHAGKKRKSLTIGSGNSLDDIQKFLTQYQIPVDLAPTKHTGHATELAKEAVKKKYTHVFVAGGDGTVGEAVNGLVGSNIALGIIPMGSVMNIARMLSIPLDLEKAIMLLKMNRCRKIDIGRVLEMDGKKLKEKTYFIESAGIGLDALIQQYFKELEDGDISGLWRIISTLFSFYKGKVLLTTDNDQRTVRATIISVANGPFSGAGIPIAPDAKLNDHTLTVALYKQDVWDLIWYFIKAVNGNIVSTKKSVEYIQAKEVKIESQRNLPLHFDARYFGKTPAHFSIDASGLNVVCGFPEDANTALKSRTQLDP